MDFQRFKKSVSASEPPGGLSPAVLALWWDAKGDWQKAHVAAQEGDDKAGAWVHAYLHRKEGDAANAGYWYRRAGKAAATSSLEAEWEAIARALLQKA
jgi:hypothetical protein